MNAPIWPIAKLVVVDTDDGLSTRIASASFYTPGLPPGEHDVYPIGVDSEAVPAIPAEPNKQEGSPAIPATAVSAGLVEPVAWCKTMRNFHEYEGSEKEDTVGYLHTAYSTTKPMSSTGWEPLYTHPPVDGLLRQALTDAQCDAIWNGIAKASQQWEDDGDDPSNSETREVIRAALRAATSAPLGAEKG